MAWNGFPTRVKNAVINRLFKKHTQTPHNNNNQKLEDIRPKIWICLPYLRNHGENLIRTLLKKIQCCPKQGKGKTRKRKNGNGKAEKRVKGGKAEKSKRRKSGKKGKRRKKG